MIGPSKDPPKNNKVNHFKVQNKMGQFDEYAVLPEQQISNSSTTTPKSIIKKALQPKNLFEANYDPFNQNYSAISASR